MVWSFLAPFAWSPTSFGNLYVHNKVMSEIELRVWLFFTWETCQVRHSQSRWLFSSTVMCRGKNWLTGVRWQLQRHMECHRVKTEQSKMYWYARQFRHWWLSVLQRKSKLQDVMREKQTPGCDRCFFFFFITVWFDLIWSALYKSPLFKEKCQKWNI